MAPELHPSVGSKPGYRQLPPAPAGARQCPNAPGQQVFLADFAGQKLSPRGLIEAATARADSMALRITPDRIAFRPRAAACPLTHHRAVLIVWGLVSSPAQGGGAHVLRQTYQDEAVARPDRGRS